MQVKVIWKHIGFGENTLFYFFLWLQINRLMRKFSEKPGIFLGQANIPLSNLEYGLRHPRYLKSDLCTILCNQHTNPICHLFLAWEPSLSASIYHADRFSGQMALSFSFLFFFVISFFMEKWCSRIKHGN